MKRIVWQQQEQNDGVNALTDKCLEQSSPLPPVPDPPLVLLLLLFFWAVKGVN